jgi:hypothetical protein
VKTAAFSRERDFQRAVCKLAKVLGCMVYHTHDSRRSEPGFPDLVIVGRHGVMFRELKAQGGRLSPEQETWIYGLRNADADAAVWRPSDWPDRVTTDLRAIA